MKKWMMVAAVIGLGTAAWSADLWNGRSDSIVTGGEMLKKQIETSDGVLAASGTVKGTGYEYIVITLPVTPFQFKDRSLAMDVRLVNPGASDSIYVKMLDAKGKIVSSFYTFSRPKDWTHLVCTPGQDAGGVKFFAKNVNAPADSTVTKLQFYIGRKGRGTTVRFEVRNMALVDTPKAAVPKTVNAAAFRGLWEEDAAHVTISKSVKDPQAEFKDGELTVSGTLTTAKYGYLIFEFPVKPFQMDGKSLAFDAFIDQPRNDSLYVKALDAKGKNVASFYTFSRPAAWTHFVCTPGQDTGGMKYFAKDVKAAGSTVTKLQFFVGRQGKESVIKIKLRKLELIKAPPAPQKAAAIDHGPAVRGGTNRGVAAVKDAQGRDAVVVWLMDDTNRRVLQIDAESGKCEAVPVPFVILMRSTLRCAAASENATRFSADIL